MLSPSEIEYYIKRGTLKSYDRCADNKCTDLGLSKVFSIFLKSIPEMLHEHCVTHDHRYWLGDWSGMSRLQADDEFRDAIKKSGEPLIADLYYFGVRIGGGGWTGMPFRWGFGWKRKPSIFLTQDTGSR